MAKSRTKAAKDSALKPSKQTSFNPNEFAKDEFLNISVLDTSAEKENEVMVTKKDSNGNPTPRAAREGKTIVLRFIKDNHLELYRRLEEGAKADDRDLSIFTLRALLEAYPAPEQQTELNFQADNSAADDSAIS